jgi:hypothetical protein
VLSASDADPRPKAWRVAAACFVSAVFAWGFGFYAHGIYLVELQKAHGWSTGLISSTWWPPRGSDAAAPAGRQLRNLRPFTTLSIVLRGPCTPMPTRSSASAGAAATAARLSASLVVSNMSAM